MITDYGDITDQSFNQNTYEGCKEFCEANKIDFKYYKPAGNTTADRVAMLGTAAATVIVKAINTAENPDNVSSTIQYIAAKKAFLVKLGSFDFNWFMARCGRRPTALYDRLRIRAAL